MKAETASLERLEASRRDVERRLAQLRGSLRKEVGWAPSSKSWILLTLALSSGLALAYLIRSRRG